MASELRNLVEREYHCRTGHAKALRGGYDCIVILIDCEDGKRVLKIAPGWRSAAQLEWSYGLVALAAPEMSQICAPFRSRDSTFVVTYADRQISLWPFIDGRPLDVSNELECDIAASTLAQLQRQLASSADRATKPYPDSRGPWITRPGLRAEHLEDADLDQWLSEQHEKEPNLGLIHGDYWCNNLICRGTKLIGIIDWDDTGLGRLDKELSRAVWEFCADSSRASLDMARARRFLEVYRDSGGIAPVDDLRFVVPFIREYLRNEIRRELRESANADTSDKGDLEINFQAFKNLRGVTI